MNDVTFIEILEWVLLLSAPFLAVSAVMFAYNAYAASRRREMVVQRDKRHEREFILWWESVQAHHGLVPTFCPLKTLAGETCYLFINYALLYEAFVPPLSNESEFAMGGEVEYEEEETSVFDVECGTTVSRDWSVMGMFGMVNFLGHCRICVMSNRLCVKGSLTEIDILFKDITSVIASCSALMIDAESLDQPLVFNCVNGQRLRDTLHILMDDDSGRLNNKDAVGRYFAKSQKQRENPNGTK